MPTIKTTKDIICIHCGEKCPNGSIAIKDNYFCCNGCKFVYELLHENNLGSYYKIEDKPGIKVSDKLYDNHFAYLDNEKISEKLLDFSDKEISIVTLIIPQIHCSSCIWLLENLQKLHSAVISSRVQFLKKEVSITFQHNKISLRSLIELLASIGYEPQISLDDYEVKTKRKKGSSLIVRVTIAGFCFANIMLFSFPEYLSSDGFLSKNFIHFFGYLNLMLSIPVLLFSASIYFKSAYFGLKQKIINMDVPISLGILILFIRSVYEIISSSGPGYFDSFTGLVFFLLIGKLFQQKTYESLSFDSDYKSYFPISIIKLTNQSEEIVPVTDLKQGDTILVRNNELIPADSKLLSSHASIDYSFVTGESAPIEKATDDKIYAGGKQLGGIIQLEVLKNVSQSYITQLWNDANFSPSSTKSLSNIANRFSKYFTISVVSIAFAAAFVWMLLDPSQAIFVGISVLIIACPCALALSTPITLGSVQRILGRNKLFFKESDTIEKLANITHILFDKTGTLTKSKSSSIKYYGKDLSNDNISYIRSLVHQSTHPLSVKLYEHLSINKTYDVEKFQELPSKGISGFIHNIEVRVGSASFCGNVTEIDKEDILESRVHISISGLYFGYYKISAQYRDGLTQLASQLSNTYKVSILSGDNQSELAALQKIFPKAESFHFQMSPMDKLLHVKELQENGDAVLMLGDGLNDSGALKQADIGIAVTENMSSFSPASDGIIASEKLADMYTYMRFSNMAISIILVSFGISILYNIFGLGFAVMGLVSPLLAAVLMPISSLTVVGFAVISTKIAAQRLGI